jgi:hypothetical protein
MTIHTKALPADMCLTMYEVDPKLSYVNAGLVLEPPGIQLHGIPPQHLICPFEKSANVELTDVATCTTGMVPISIDASGGLSLPKVSPYPSCPSELEPQHLSAPRVNMAHIHADEEPTERFSAL